MLSRVIRAVFQIKTFKTVQFQQSNSKPPPTQPQTSTSNEAKASQIAEENLNNESTTEKNQEKSQTSKNNTSSLEDSERQDKDNQDDDNMYRKQNRNTMGWKIYRVFFWGFMISLGLNTYLVWTHEKSTPVEDETGAVPFVIDLAKSAVASYRDLNAMMFEPPAKKLLPDIIHPLVQPKTLVLNLTGTLLKTDFIFGKGMVVIRRPGLDNFLRRLSQKYEIVVFSNDDYMFVANSPNVIDPKHMFIMYYFGNQCMTWTKGKYYKELKYLNRDMKDIVVIDHDKDIVLGNQENIICLPKFEGDQNDQELIKLLPFLQTMAGPEVSDVRKYLKRYGDKPYEAFYEQIKNKQQVLKEKQNSSVFGVFKEKKSSANRKSKQQEF